MQSDTTTHSGGAGPATSRPALTSQDVGASVRAPEPGVPVQVSVVVMQPSKESGHANDVADLAASLAPYCWPLVLLVAGVYFRSQISQFMNALAVRVADPRTSIKVGGFELTRQIDALQSKVESLEVDKQVLAASNTAPTKSFTTDQAMASLRELASEYESVNMESYAERVSRKDQIAAQMAVCVNEGGIDRRALAEQSSQGLLMALATAVHTNPQADDANLLMLAGPKAERLHVRYRFMMAVSRLAQRGLLSRVNAEKSRILCAQYLNRADAPLRKRIRITMDSLHDLLDGDMPENPT